MGETMEQIQMHSIDARASENAARIKAQALEKLSERMRTELQEKADQERKNYDSRMQDQRRDEERKREEQKREEQRKQEEKRQQELRAEARKYAEQKAREMLEKEREKERKREQMQARKQENGEQTQGQMQQIRQRGAKGPSMQPSSGNSELDQLRILAAMDHPALTDTQKLILNQQYGVEIGQGWHDREAERRKEIEQEKQNGRGVNAQMREQVQEKQGKQVQQTEKMPEKEVKETEKTEQKAAPKRESFEFDKQAELEQEKTR